MANPTLDARSLVFSATASHRGRHVSVSPQNSALTHLHYGRVILDREVASAEFSTEGREVALLALRGRCRVTVNGSAYELDTHDAIYLPRGSRVSVTTDTEVDLVECGADVDGDYPLQVVRYSDVKQDPSLKFRAGGESTSRELNVIIGQNVDAGRILAGFTRSLPGHWTSWPPHEHGELLEEMYVYFDMPAPAFGIQMVYTDAQTPEFVHVVRDGDAVLMPAGYHPNVAAPGHGINFVWMMAAHREGVDRKFGVVNVQPGFDRAGTGLEASQKK